MRRDSHLPLLIAAVLALGVHLAVLSSPVLAFLKRITPAAHAATLTPPPAEPSPEKAQEKSPEETPPEEPEPPKPEEEKAKPPEPPPPPPEPETPKPEPPPPPPPAEPPPAAPQPEPSAPEPVSVEVGQEDAPRISTVAWIAWDDYQELIAQQQRTLQPALQRDVIAQPTAPANTEAGMPQERYDLPQLAAGIATPNPQGDDSRPAAQPSASAQPAPATQPTDPPLPVATVPPEPPAAASAARPLATTDVASSVPPAVPLPIELPALAGQDDTLAIRPPLDQPPATEPETPLDPPDPDTQIPPPQEQLALGPAALPNRAQTVEPSIPSDTEAPNPDEAATKPDPTAADASSDRYSKPAAGDGGQTERSASLATEPSPTSIPLTDREAIATMDKPSDDSARLGRVITSRGIEIKTVRPRFSIATLYTATPRNPRARVVFDATGQVIRAELTRSSGYPDIDSPIINSLYQWRAEGKMIEAMNSGTFEWQGTILLVDEPDLP